MTVKHNNAKGEVVNTHFGSVKLDPRGIVVNLHELKCDPEELAALAGFGDADLFPPHGYIPGEGVQEVSSVKDPTAEQLWEIIQEVTKNHTVNINREGLIDMQFLIPALKERGFKAVTGTRRKEVTAEFKDK